MNAVIDRFGKIVSNTLIKDPKLSRELLKAGYFANGMKMKYLPDKRLLPHQKYASIISNNTIRIPLSHPENSAAISVFMPCEMLHAMDITPQFAEGLACYLNGAGCEHAFVQFAEDYGIPQTYCSYHKILLGAALKEVLPKPRFVLNTTYACDANNNTFRLLSKFWHLPHFTIDVPDRNTPEAVSYLEEQFCNLKNFMEEIIGKEMKEESLKAIFRRENNSVRLYRKHLNVLHGKYLPNDMTSEMYKIFMTHVLLGTKEAQKYFELLLKDTENASDSKNEIRILWVHTMPFWQDSIKNIFNFSKKYQLLCCDLNLDYIQEMDETSPYKAMAQKLLCNTLGQFRTKALLEMAKTLGAQGVIYFCHWGCKNTLGNAYYAKEQLEAAGIPTLILDGDGCDKRNVNDGQMQTRLQAFLEILEEKQ